RIEARPYRRIEPRRHPRLDRLDPRRLDRDVRRLGMCTADADQRIQIHPRCQLARRPRLLHRTRTTLAILDRRRRLRLLADHLVDELTGRLPRLRGREVHVDRDASRDYYGGDRNSHPTTHPTSPFFKTEKFRPAIRPPASRHPCRPPPAA